MRKKWQGKSKNESKESAKQGTRKFIMRKLISSFNLFYIYIVMFQRGGKPKK